MISEHPVATIVITSKNRKDDLRMALQSVVVQTAPIEVIVIDDGSSDGTSEMVRSEFPGVRLFQDEESKGLIVQRNNGAERARTPIIFSIDDDAAFTDKSIVADIVAQFDDPRIGAVTIPNISVKYNTDLQESAPDSRYIYVADHFTGTAHALRRDVFLALGGYKSFFFHQGEEGEYCIRMLNAGYFVRQGISEPIHHYESPKRDPSRQIYFGNRNLVLFTWYNVPSVFLLPHMAVTIFNGIARSKMKRKAIAGIVAGLTSIPGQWSVRKPVDIAVYRLHRRLKKSAGIPIEQVREILERRTVGEAPPRRRRDQPAVVGFPMKKKVLHAVSRLLCGNQIHDKVFELKRGKVLVLMLTHLGDVVLFLPFLDALGEFFGSRSIDIVVKPPVDQLICSHAALRRIHVFNCPWVGAGGWGKGIVQWLGFIKKFRSEKYDLAIVSHAHELSSLAAYLCGAKETAGWAFDGDRFLDCPLVVLPWKQHAAEFAAQLMEHLDLPPVPRRSGLPVAGEDFRKGEDIVIRLKKAKGGTGAGILVVHPGAGGERKIWPPGNFSAVIKAFLERNHSVILLGGEKEGKICTGIANRIGCPDRVVDLCGKLGVGELAGVISGGDAYIGNDSGPSHMAATLGVPSYVIFGQASDPDVWSPVGPRVHVMHFQEGEFRSFRSAEKVLMVVGADLAH